MSRLEKGASYIISGAKPDSAEVKKLKNPIGFVHTNKNLSDNSVESPQISPESSLNRGGFDEVEFLTKYSEKYEEAEALMRKFVAAQEAVNKKINFSEELATDLDSQHKKAANELMDLANQAPVDYAYVSDIGAVRARIDELVKAQFEIPISQATNEVAPPQKAWERVTDDEPIDTKAGAKPEEQSQSPAEPDQDWTFSHLDKKEAISQNLDQDQPSSNLNEGKQSDISPESVAVNVPKEKSQEDEQAVVSEKPTRIRKGDRVEYGNTKWEVMEFDPSTGEANLRTKVARKSEEPSLKYEPGVGIRFTDLLKNKENTEDVDLKVSQKDLYDQNLNFEKPKWIQELREANDVEQQTERSYDTDGNPVSKIELEVSVATQKTQKAKVSEQKTQESAEASARIQKLKEKIAELGKEEQDKLRKTPGVINKMEVERDYGKQIKEIKVDIRKNQKIKAKSFFSRLLNFFR